MGIYQDIFTTKGNKLALLIDPDRTKDENLKCICKTAQEQSVDFILVGGSLLWHNIGDTVSAIKQNCSLPVVLFPGNAFQVCPQADGILFLSLISGRNPELLIGQHVLAAPMIKQTNLEVLPTGYMLIGGGSPTSVEYMSNTRPIPANKPEIAVATALAGQMLGQKLLYLEGGSGSDSTVPTEVISSVQMNVDIPLLVGGGIRTPRQMKQAFEAGAKVVVLGTIIEEQPSLLSSFAEMKNRK